MKFLKGFALGLLNLLLALSLFIFGLAFTINSTVLNPGFVRVEIKDLDMAALTREFVDQTNTEARLYGGIPPQEMSMAVTATVTQLEPLLKERVAAVTDSVYDYLLGKKPNPELAVTLRGTLLKTDFFTAIIDNLDITSMTRDILRQQLASNRAPAEFQKYIDASLAKVVADIKPIIKQQIEASADPVLDYLGGKTENFSITINSVPLMASLKTAIHDAVFASPPPEFVLQSPAQKEAYFNQRFDILAGGIPPAFELNQTNFGSDLRAGIADSIKATEDALVQARPYIGYFQSGYKLLIVFMLLLVAGIVLIHREVKASARSLGITFTSYGVFGYTGVLVGRYFAGARLQEMLVGIPPSLQAWLIRFFDRFLSPMATLSLVLLVAGVILLVVSFVYKKREPTRITNNQDVSTEQIK